MSRNAIALPQVSSGVVKRVLLAIWTEMPAEPITKDWLEARRFSQAPQILDMLSFAGIVNSSSSVVVDDLRACRDDAKAFYRTLRGLVVQAYANAGFGAAESLGWLGRDRLDDRQLRASLDGKGPFRHLDSSAGGAKNARSCLKGLHSFLLEWRRRHGRKSSDLPPPGPKEGTQPLPIRRGPTVTSEPGGTVPGGIVQKRFSDLQAAREFAGQLPLAAPTTEGQEDRKVIRVPFSDNSGDWKTALICFQSQPTAGCLLALGRMLQSMGEEMTRTERGS